MCTVQEASFGGARRGLIWLEHKRNSVGGVGITADSEIMQSLDCWMLPRLRRRAAVACARKALLRHTTIVNQARGDDAGQGDDGKNKEKLFF